MKQILTTVIAILIITCTQAQNNSLTINISNIQNHNSSLFIGIYDNKINFKSKTDALDSLIVIPKENTKKVKFTNLPKGEYAIAIFQDINNNGKLDSGKFNIPNEPVGISNYGTKKVISPPTFNKAKIKINGDTIVSIPLISK